MTETASLISVTHPFKPSRGSIGKLMPGYEVNLDQSGEICVRDRAFHRATGHPKARRFEQPNNGCTPVTLERSTIREIYTSRAALKMSSSLLPELSIYPEDLEEALNRQPEVNASCVINSQGANGDEPLAVVILKKSSANVAAIIDRANRSLAEYQRIRRWHIWKDPDFPLTSTQKILRRQGWRQLKQEWYATSTFQCRIAPLLQKPCESAVKYFRPVRILH